MRLESVYLVAPEPKPPSMPTRRAFLIAGCTFAAGVGLGGACGYAAGVGRGGESGGEPRNASGSGGAAQPLDANDKAPLDWEPSDDALLEELRRLAVKAPIEELVQKRHDFLDLLFSNYPKDAIAWTGVGRLAEHTLSNEELPDRRIFARWVAQVIEKSHASVRTPLLKWVPELRQIR